MKFVLGWYRAPKVVVVAISAEHDLRETLIAASGLFSHARRKTHVTRSHALTAPRSLFATSALRNVFSDTSKRSLAPARHAHCHAELTVIGVPSFLFQCTQPIDATIAPVARERLRALQLTLRNIRARST